MKLGFVIFNGFYTIFWAIHFILFAFGSYKPDEFTVGVALAQSILAYATLLLLSLRGDLD